MSDVQSDVQNSGPNWWLDPDGNWHDLALGADRTVSVHVTTAQIATLHSAPVVLIGAPGAGRVIVPVFASLEYKGVLLAGWNASVGLYFDVNAVGASNLFTNSLVDSFGFTTGAGIVVGSNLPLLLSSGSEPVPTGKIVTASLDVGGSGYAPGDTGSISQGDSSARYAVDTVDGGGAVLTFHITNPGNPGQCHVETGVSTNVLTGGGDGGFTVNIDAITPAGGDMFVTVDYKIVTLQ